MKGPVLVIPSLVKGQGGGHLVRSRLLVRSLRELGREAFLFLGGGDFPSLNEKMNSRWIISGRNEAAEKRWDSIVLDDFRTPVEAYRFWSALGPLVGIDEGGPCRSDFDFLIDLLPDPPHRSQPNILDPSLLPLPKNRRPNPWAAPQVPAAHTAKETGTGMPLKILISFGAEDPAGLG
jgi:hypothetical protein